MGYFLGQKMMTSVTELVHKSAVPHITTEVTENRMGRQLGLMKWFHDTNLT